MQYCLSVFDYTLNIYILILILIQIRVVGVHVRLNEGDILTPQVRDRVSQNVRWRTALLHSSLVAPLKPRSDWQVSGASYVHVHTTQVSCSRKKNPLSSRSSNQRPSFTTETCLK